MEKSTKVEREAIRAVLVQMDTESRLTPSSVIEEARNPESPLHAEFTWDVTEAAQKTWLHEARMLISSFVVSVTVNKREYRVQEFVEHPLKPEASQGYTAISNIKSSKAMAREFVERELAMATAYVSKTKDYATILGLRNRVEELVNDIEGLRSEVQGQPQAAA